MATAAGVRRLGRSVSAASLGAATAALAACGSTDELRVAAAASLRVGLGDACADRACAFAGSDALAAQVRRGAPIDVLVAADAAVPRRLWRDGLLERPVAVATNELVVAVPSDSPIRSVDDLGAPGASLALGAPGVPVGAYAEAVLRRLPAVRRAAILDTVRSREPSVAGVVAKLREGAVDAGFVYRTDVTAAAGGLRAVRLPAGLRPDVVLAAGVVRAPGDRGEARAFVAGLRGRDAQRALRRAGFGPPP